MQERAANLGYDWPSIVGVLDKVAEELEELAPPAPTLSGQRSSATSCSYSSMSPDGTASSPAAPRGHDKFRRRFRSVERQAAEQGVALRDLDFDALDELWHAAKAEETAR